MQSKVCRNMGGVIQTTKGMSRTFRWVAVLCFYIQCYLYRTRTIMSIKQCCLIAELLSSTSRPLHRPPLSCDLDLLLDLSLYRERRDLSRDRERLCLSRDLYRTCMCASGSGSICSDRLRADGTCCVACLVPVASQTF